jgi:hypothetical protein
MAWEQVSSDADADETEGAIAHQGPSGCALPARQGSVPVYGIVQARGGAPLRVVGRQAFKNGTESAKRMLLDRFSSLVDQPQRDKLLGARTQAMARSPHPVSVSMWPTCVYVLRAPITSLDRPPRV